MISARHVVLRTVRENEHWDHRGVGGELAALGVRVASSAVWEIFKRHGVEPAPRHLGPGWAEFLRSKAQADRGHGSVHRRLARP